MSFVIKLKGEFKGYYAGLYLLHGQSFVGCVDDINDKHIQKYKKRCTAKKHIEEIKNSASYEKKCNGENIICSILEISD